MNLPRMRVVNGDELTLLIDGQLYYLYHICGYEELSLYAHRARMNKREMAQLIYDHLQPIARRAQELESEFQAKHGVSAREAEGVLHPKYEAWSEMLEGEYGQVFGCARDAAMASAGFVEIKSNVGFFSRATDDRVHDANEHLGRIVRGEDD